MAAARIDIIATTLFGIAIFFLSAVGVSPKVKRCYGQQDGKHFWISGKCPEESMACYVMKGCGVIKEEERNCLTKKELEDLEDRSKNLNINFDKDKPESFCDLATKVNLGCQHCRVCTSDMCNGGSKPGGGGQSMALAMVITGGAVMLAGWLSKYIAIGPM